MTTAASQIQTRTLVDDDVPAVAALIMRTAEAHSWERQSDCEDYLRRVLFDNPWRDSEIGSWVAERKNEIAGFFAVMPRPMELDGQRLRAAVGCQMMIDPRHRNSLVALELMKAGFSGPQDLTLVDGANASSYKMWSLVSGTFPLLYNLEWTRLLRPARHALSVLDEHEVLPRALSLMARPAAALADSAAARLQWNQFDDDDELTTIELDAAKMVVHLPEVLHGSKLRPIYDRDSLAWLLNEASGKRSLGKLRARGVCRDGRLVGWYLYYLRPGATSEVLQAEAYRGAYDDVLVCLFADATRNGAAALRGRVDPRYVLELSARHCWMRREGPFVMVHSRREDVRTAIEEGCASLSRLEGEWWLRFRGA